MSTTWRSASRSAVCQLHIRNNHSGPICGEDGSDQNRNRWVAGRRSYRSGKGACSHKYRSRGGQAHQRELRPKPNVCKIIPTTTKPTPVSRPVRSPLNTPIATPTTITVKPMSTRTFDLNTGSAYDSWAFTVNTEFRAAIAMGAGGPRTLISFGNLASTLEEDSDLGANYFDERDDCR